MCIPVFVGLDASKLAGGNSLYFFEGFDKIAKVIKSAAVSYICYVHIGADIITLCSMLRIPVCMHNVPEERIFRPASWNAFGMDKEGQDYRDCASYGPMYKNIR